MSAPEPRCSDVGPVFARKSGVVHGGQNLQRPVAHQITQLCFSHALLEKAAIRTLVVDRRIRLPKPLNLPVPLWCQLSHGAVSELDPGW